MRQILVHRANQMRREPTAAENVLYLELLKAFEPFEATVKCQEPIGYYIADFMIYPSRVVIECDGAHHRTAKGAAYDRRRDNAFRQLGIRTFRFANGEIINAPRKVAAEILEHCSDSLVLKGSIQRPEVTHCPPASGLKRKKPSRKYYDNLLAFNSRYRR